MIVEQCFKCQLGEELKRARSECQSNGNSNKCRFGCLRARQVYYLGGHAPESGEIIGNRQKLKDDMPADLADSLKADEEDCMTDHEPLDAAKEKEVATLKATTETHLQQGDIGTEVDHVKGDLTETDGEQRGVVRWGGGAPEEQSRRTQEQIVAEEVISTVERRFLWPCGSTGGRAQRKGCGWLAKAQATARVDVPTARRQCCGFFCFG